MTRCWCGGCSLALIILSAVGSATWLAAEAFLVPVNRITPAAKIGKSALHRAVQRPEFHDDTFTLAAPFPLRESFTRSFRNDAPSVHVYDHNNNDNAEVGDLNHSLGVLKAELEEKNQQFHQKVQILRDESLQWDAYYRTKIDKLGTKQPVELERIDQQNAWDDHFNQVTGVQNPEHEKSFADQEQNTHQYENLPTHQEQQDVPTYQKLEQQTSTHREQEEPMQMELNESVVAFNYPTAADKVYWLAEQLHKIKFQAHQQELEAELAAHNTLLQSKLEKLQEDLERQLQVNKSERAKNAELLQQRNSLANEVSAMKNQLQETIRGLKERLDVEQEQRVLERKRHQDQLAQQEAELQGQLRQARDQAESAMEALKRNLQEKDVRDDRSFQLQQAETEADDAESAYVSAAEYTRLLAIVRQKDEELADQAALTAAAKAEANAQRASRVELEREFSDFKRKYDQAEGDWNNRFTALENAHVIQLRAAEQRLANKESETAETIRAVYDESDATKAALNEELKTKDAHYKQRIKELRQTSEQEMKSLRGSLESLSLEVQHSKAENDQRLAAEKKAFQIEQDQLISEIAAKEEELRTQVSLTATAEQISRVHWERREELEKEIAALKHKHETSMLEWVERYKCLQMEFTSKLQIMEALVSQTKEKARLEINAAHHDANERCLALEKSIEDKDAEHLLELKHLADSSQKKERELNSTIHSLTAGLERYKLDSERQVAATKEAAESELNELRALLSTRETHYNEQIELALATNHSRADIARTKKLEAELSSQKLDFESNITHWESRYNALLQSRDEALQEAEALLTRRESEARELIDCLSSELETVKTAYAESLKAKDRELEVRIQEVRASSETRLEEMQQDLEEVCASYQQFKREARGLIDRLNLEAGASKSAYSETLRAKDRELDSRVQEVRDSCDKRLREVELELKVICDNSELFKLEAGKILEAEREVARKNYEELRLQVQEKESVIVGLLAMSAAHWSNQIEQHTSTQRLRDLESQLITLQKKYETDAAGWEAKYSNVLKEAQAREEMAASELWSRTKVEFDQKLQFVTQESQIRQREMKAEIQAQAIRHSHDMEELAQAYQKKEDELSQQLHAITVKLNCFEAKAQQALEAEKAASLASKVDLVSQVEQKQTQLLKVLELLAQERAKNGQRS